MAQVIALAAAPMRISRLDVLRSVFVCGCAIALIAAGQAFPL